MFPRGNHNSGAQYWCYICSHDRYLLALINPIPYPYLPPQCVRPLHNITGSTQYYTKYKMQCFFFFQKSSKRVTHIFGIVFVSNFFWNNSPPGIFPKGTFTCFRYMETPYENRERALWKGKILISPGHGCGYLMLGHTVH